MTKLCRSESSISNPAADWPSGAASDGKCRPLAADVATTFVCDEPSQIHPHNWSGGFSTGTGHRCFFTRALYDLQRVEEESDSAAATWANAPWSGDTKGATVGSKARTSSS